MRYRTVIEIICEEIDAENALHTAGEYLRGNIETGVVMNCKTSSWNLHLAKRLCLSGLILALLSSTFFFSVTRLEGKNICELKETAVYTP